MRYFYILFLLCIFLVSCESDCDSWRHAPENYKCSSEDMQRVISETQFCKSNIKNEYDGYCYGTAILRNCIKMEKQKR
jgi:hypothetical protein